MEPPNFLKEEIYNVYSIITLVASNEMCHLEESIDKHYNSILSSRGPWKGYNKVYANVIPRP